MKTVRAFLAVPVCDQVRRDLAGIQDQLRKVLRDVRWIRPETVHLTLQFLGDVAEEELAETGRIMLSIGRLFSPFEVRVRGVGAFPSSARPRVIWAGLENQPLLFELERRLRQELIEIGLTVENRPFSPHLTLGRFRRRTGPVIKPLSPFRDAAIGSLPVDRLILFESQLRPAGAVHVNRFSVSLGQSGGEEHADRSPH